MRSMHAVNQADAPALTEAGVPRPEPGPLELLIRVCAAGVTPTELSWYPTWHTKAGERRKNPIPGHEFSGVAAAAGKEVTGFSIGDEVYGMNDWFEDGATAEYCLTLASSIASKPAKLSHAEAASVPIGALTAWQGLFDRAQLQPGAQVLIQGSAGGVGVFAVQLARSRGARVAATASPKNFDFVRSLGAEELIDYHSDYFRQNTGRFDIVFDVLGGEVLERSWPLLKPGGRMITIASPSENAAEERVKRAFFIVEPNQTQLIAIANMLESGRLMAVVDQVVSFQQAAVAYTGEVPGRRGRGKVVIDVANECDTV